VACALGALLVAIVVRLAEGDEVVVIPEQGLVAAVRLAVGADELTCWPSRGRSQIAAGEVVSGEDSQPQRAQSSGAVRIALRR